MNRTPGALAPIITGPMSARHAQDSEGKTCRPGSGDCPPQEKRMLEAVASCEKSRPTLHYSRRATANLEEIAGCFVGLLRSEEHTSELQSRFDLVCRLLLEKK